LILLNESSGFSMGSWVVDEEDATEGDDFFFGSDDDSGRRDLVGLGGGTFKEDEWRAWPAVREGNGTGWRIVVAA
jgi:hypothetical protein